MTLAELIRGLDPDAVGREMHDLIGDLYPLCRSITGNGVRETLRVIQKRVPLKLQEVPSGTPVFDWIVPQEWNVRDAYVQDSAGHRVIDFRHSNLHVVSYSRPVRRTMTLAELRPHLFALPDRPDWIPYRTTYYKDDWGFCLSQRQLDALQEGTYEVCIDASLTDGHLTYGELYLPGERTEEVLISCHICHPSLCNDNLSGIAAATFLAERLAKVSRRYSYRLLFSPGTIGSITWLWQNEQRLKLIKHGLVLSLVGDEAPYTYKKSRRGDTEIDRAAAQVLSHQGEAYRTIDFFPYGYDERQFCSPAFNLPVGCLMRSQHGTFPEYHTSADNLSFVTPAALGRSLVTVLSICRVLEENRSYLNLNPKCEPQLGKRGLYHAVGGQRQGGFSELALLWVLNLSDGTHSLLDIAERAHLPFEMVSEAAQALVRHDLLRDWTR
jgi:aminopeptidase-like protein